MASGTLKFDETQNEEYYTDPDVYGFNVLKGCFSYFSGFGADARIFRRIISAQLKNCCDAARN